MTATPSPHVARLSAWLHEWSIHETLSHEATDDFPAFNSGLADADDTLPCPGHIRLMHPATAGLAHPRPIYFTILSIHPDSATIVPFGPLATPAVPGEWSTGLEPPCLRVLSLWNHARVHPRALRHSWPARELDEQTLAVAATLLDCVLTDSPPPPQHEPTCGPPLIHPLDPRHEYLDRERMLMETVCRESALPSGFYQRDTQNLRLAAEDRETYGNPPETPDDPNRT